MSKLSVSIVTFNSSDVISNLLDSLAKCNVDKVYVVDNSSTDDTIEIIEKKYPWVILIKSQKNLGYGAGHNLAIKQIDSTIHIIINPDIIVEKEQVSKIRNFMDENLNVSLMCPKVLNIDGSEQFLPKLNPKIKYLFGGFFGVKKLRNEYTMKNVSIKNPINIDFCTGCFMICRTEYLKKCGGFDDRYFLYFEDADLSRELKKYGDVIYNPNITVTHVWKRENGHTIKGIIRFLSSYRKYRKKWKK